ncbi:hypothetical protein BASA60_005586 [Batrachochytrium salamandrivorans]|nr:hypothetical protein BASA60_005586 [Batrachochytrium salamandrivorans]
MAPMRFDRAVVKYVASALDLGLTAITAFATMIYQLWILASFYFHSPHPGEDLERRLAAATSYDEWRCIALELDILNGNQAWKATQDTSLYDHKLIYTRLQSLRQNCASGDLETLIILLRSGLLRNLGGISDVRLYKHSLTGTKILIEDYLKEVVTQFDTIYNSGFSVLNGAQKALMFNDTQQSFGCTALLLQGGVTFGMYHIGVVKSLFERGLLPRIISGTSVGALIAALVCIHTDVELPGIFSPGGINLEPFSRKDSKGAISRKISRILKHGYLLDVSVIEQCVKENLGDYTFKEAYLRTGRILNIPVAAYRKGEIPQLLNYLTAPKVLIRSAACAAVGLVGLYQTRDLLAKSKDGSIFTWCPSATNGAHVANPIVENPEKRLAELFNVNHFIVSQASPYISPFIMASSRSFFRKIEGLFFSELRYRLGQLGEIRLVPQFILSLFGHKLQGHVTIAPELTSMDFYTLFNSPTYTTLSYWILKGEKSTWPSMSLISNRLMIEIALDKATSKAVVDSQGQGSVNDISIRRDSTRRRNKSIS